MITAVGNTCQGHGSDSLRSFGAFFVLTEQGGSKAVQLVVQIILARLLSPEAFGVLAILLVVRRSRTRLRNLGWGWRALRRAMLRTGRTPLLGG